MKNGIFKTCVENFFLIVVGIKYFQTEVVEAPVMEKVEEFAEIPGI